MKFLMNTLSMWIVLSRQKLGVMSEQLQIKLCNEQE